MNLKSRNELVNLLKTLNLPLIVAEIGVAEGRFSRDLLSQGIEHLYLVDRWQSVKTQKGDGGYPQNWHDSNYNQMKDRLKEWEQSKYTVLKMDSVEAANSIPNNSLGMVYLDADHSYEGFSRDIVAYFDKVCKGGVVAGHDVLNNDYGVGKGLKEFCIKNKITYTIIPENEPNNASFYFIKP